MFDYYILPFDFKEQLSFIRKYKNDMMEQIINSIEYAISNKLPYIEVFQFKNSNFVVILKDRDYLPNLNHVLEYCTEQELYELCSKIKKLKELLNK